MFQSPEDPQPTYTFELTTNFFAIDSSGVLVVNEENLDRDPPSPGRFRFQVVAREKSGIAASSPLSFVVTLNDVNDNAPVLPMTAPISVQAGEAKREVIKVRISQVNQHYWSVMKLFFYYTSDNIMIAVSYAHRIASYEKGVLPCYWGPD